MLGWIGNLFIVAGLWGIGNKWRPAFLFSIVGEAAYILRSYLVQDWALFAICWIFLIMAIRGYIKWGNSE
jgi:hypothetical protein